MMPKLTILERRRVLAGEESKWFPGADIEFGFLTGIENMAEEMAQQAGVQIEQQFGKLEEHLNTHLSDLSKTLGLAGLSAEKTQEVQERVERARRHAAHSSQRAQVKLERKLAQAQRKATRHARYEKRKAVEFDVEALLASKEKGAEAISDEDRMAILKMLRDKKITPQQADELLSALEGAS